jgi:copper chaperone
MPTITLSVPDMSCGSCVGHIRQALSIVPGMQDQTIDLQRRQVRFTAADPATLQAAQARLADAGYPATVVTA